MAGEAIRKWSYDCSRLNDDFHRQARRAGWLNLPQDALNYRLVTEYAAASEIGSKRLENQDACASLSKEHFGFYLVADGLGGNLAGGVAAKLLVQTTIDFLSNLEEVELSDVFYALARGNLSIQALAKSNPSYRGMASTLCCFSLIGNRVLTCNVGDSRVYRLRGGRLEQLTRDHTLCAELSESIENDLSPVLKSRISHILTRSVGRESRIEIDYCFDRIEVGDRYLACSDGVHSVLDDETIAKVIQSGTVQESLNKMFKIVNGAGQPDDTTAILLEVVQLAASECESDNGLSETTVIDRDSLSELFPHRRHKPSREGRFGRRDSKTSGPPEGPPNKQSSEERKVVAPSHFKVSSKKNIPKTPHKDRPVKRLNRAHLIQTSSPSPRGFFHHLFHTLVQSLFMLIVFFLVIIGVLGAAAIFLRS